jgi:tRNA(adenine34) deaminase
MAQAVQLANSAASAGEVPVGAVIVHTGVIVGTGSNNPIATHDPSAHAEINAIRAAAKSLENYRLTGTTMYVTLEPCCMCAGAILNARIDRVVFGCRDERAGAVGSQLNLLESPFLNHRCRVEAGVLENDCRQLLQAFFATKRKLQGASQD